MKRRSFVAALVGLPIVQKLDAITVPEPGMGWITIQCDSGAIERIYFSAEDPGSWAIRRRGVINEIFGVPKGHTLAINRYPIRLWGPGVDPYDVLTIEPIQQAKDYFRRPAFSASLVTGPRK
jgi:hypothetical protein